MKISKAMLFIVAVLAFMIAPMTTMADVSPGISYSVDSYHACAGPCESDTDTDYLTVSQDMLIIPIQNYTKPDKQINRRRFSNNGNRLFVTTANLWRYQHSGVIAA